MNDPQLSFDMSDLITPDYTPDLTIQERWELWRDANPWVLPKVESLIAAKIAAGHKRIGIKQVWEVLRYGYEVTTGDPFKCNNDFTSRASREILARRPEWSQFIETRELRAA